jgi:hypothetical protein
LNLQIKHPNNSRYPGLNGYFAGKKRHCKVQLLLSARIHRLPGLRVPAYSLAAKSDPDLFNAADTVNSNTPCPATLPLINDGTDAVMYPLPVLLD